MMSWREYYILEHPRRGTFREMDHDWRAGQRIDIPRFSLTGSRNDSEKCMQFRTVEQAMKMARRIVDADGKLARTLTLRRAPDFHWYCKECKHWIDDFMQAQNGHDPACPRRNH